jgi:hypothetical protein
MKRRQTSGFALVITLVLLALLVLAVLALSALTKVGSETASTGTYQTQARQNALLGLTVAIGQLQRHAGSDLQLTSIANLTSMPVGPNNPARYWCGAWTENSVTWLASGGENGTIPDLTGSDAVVLVANGSLGAYTATNETDRVFALRIAVKATNAAGETTPQGSYAYWVGDEGTKLSAVLADIETPVGGKKHELSALISGLDPGDLRLASVITYEQLDKIAGITPGNKQASFHALGVTHHALVGAQMKAGLLNVNSGSARYWSAVAATYNRLRVSGTPINTLSFGTLMSSHMGLAEASAGKTAGGPFPTVIDFLNSNALGTALGGSGGNLLGFKITMEPWFTVRSDTFRVRAYGEALNLADSSRIESLAYCEAIVQRIPEQLSGFGRRFRIINFRWLTPPNSSDNDQTDI